MLGSKTAAKCKDFSVNTVKLVELTARIRTTSSNFVWYFANVTNTKYHSKTGKTLQLNFSFNKISMRSFRKRHQNGIFSSYCLHLKHLKLTSWNEQHAWDDDCHNHHNTNDHPDNNTSFSHPTINP